MHCESVSTNPRGVFAFSVRRGLRFPSRPPIQGHHLSVLIPSLDFLLFDVSVAREASSLSGG